MRSRREICKLFFKERLSAWWFYTHIIQVKSPSFFFKVSLKSFLPHSVKAWHISSIISGCIPLRLFHLISIVVAWTTILDGFSSFISSISFLLNCSPKAASFQLTLNPYARQCRKLSGRISASKSMQIDLYMS